VAQTGTSDASSEAPGAIPPFRAEAGALYVVATPIGNLRDVTLRALDILRSADIVAAEDTRVTATLLRRHGITTKPVSVRAHNEAQRASDIVAALAAGRSVALVSDAGTPAVSDPGARVVRAVRDAGHRVVPVPGASAVATAVAAAGLRAERFVFVGFLPVQAKARRALLDALAPLPLALVVYEAPHRVRETVVELAHALGARDLVVARELTKAFETIAAMPLADAARWFADDENRSRGEFVLIVDLPAQASAGTLTADAQRWLEALAGELPPARAARVVAHVTGAPRDQCYARALALAARRRGGA
jgi:16S rRNA (cytidine1402-2'-O)-methyltransferase